MRFLAVIMIWVVLVGGLSLFVNRQRAEVAGGYVPPAPVSGGYWLEVTPAFSVTPDAFALQSEQEPAAALTVRLNQGDVLVVRDRLPAGQPLQVKPLSGLVGGLNEFLVKAQPADTQLDQANALRLRLYRESEMVWEQTFWSEPFHPLVATGRVALAAADASGEDGHGH